MKNLISFNLKKKWDLKHFQNFPNEKKFEKTEKFNSIK